MRFLMASFSALAVTIACGGNGTTISDAGSDGAACITPVEGASCSPNDTACEPPGDVCCIGYAWICQNGAWTKASVGCACLTDSGGGGGPFACGPSTTCSSGSRYCVDQAPGIALPDGGTPPDSYSCDALPPACQTNPTCACVKANGACSPTAVASCDESSGQVTVHCMGE